MCAHGMVVLTGSNNGFLLRDIGIYGIHGIPGYGISTRPKIKVTAIKTGVCTLFSEVDKVNFTPAGLSCKFFTPCGVVV